MLKKISLGLRVNGVSPGHVRFQLFANLIPEEQAHSEATRASLGGELMLRVEEFVPFVELTGPHILKFREGCRELCDKYVEDFARIKEAYDVRND